MKSKSKIDIKEIDKYFSSTKVQDNLKKHVAQVIETNNQLDRSYQIKPETLCKRFNL